MSNSIGYILALILGIGLADFTGEDTIPKYPSPEYIVLGLALHIAIQLGYLLLVWLVFRKRIPLSDYPLSVKRALERTKITRSVEFWTLKTEEHLILPICNPVSSCIIVSPSFLESISSMEKQGEAVVAENLYHYQNLNRFKHLILTTVVFLFFWWAASTYYAPLVIAIRTTERPLYIASLLQPMMWTIFGNLALIILLKKASWSRSIGTELVLKEYKMHSEISKMELSLGRPIPDEELPKTFNYLREKEKDARDLRRIAAMISSIMVLPSFAFMFLVTLSLLFQIVFFSLWFVFLSFIPLLLSVIYVPLKIHDNKEMERHWGPKTNAAHGE